ncbi:MAG TPA: ABC transporter ATP-binding protein [Candidatus Acidoferrum sp.]|nr:ABC transporter ATP-binding protein [Candidatus Acidoferrum sp.]
MAELGQKVVIRLDQISKSFGPVRAVDTISLEVFDGEILTLLGPSGCGKTTLMRLIAGFEQPTAGRVLIGGQDVTLAPPERRPVNLVFQRYALFPHLDVFDNIAFGLRLRKIGKDEIRDRVNQMLRIVQLPDFSNRWTHQLSGGQAQRVALARALVNKPAVLLLDEPLAALDLKIRQQMLVELKRIHAETGTTFIFVTHDQDEAMILSDRIVLMHQGHVVQIDAPERMYTRPTSLFCAQFLGDTNLLPARVVAVGGAVARCDIGFGVTEVPADGLAMGDQVTLSVRPETIVLSPDDGAAGGGVLRGEVADLAFIGNRVVYWITLGNERMLRCQEPRTVAGLRFHSGTPVCVSWPKEANVVLRE